MTKKSGLHKPLTRRSFIKAAGFGGIGLILSGTSLASAKQPADKHAAARKLAGTKPNIIFILTDDLGYGDLACNGNTLIKTPNLDQLHNESIRFTDFQVSPTCSPTRAALMTGRHEFRSGVTHTFEERERLSLQATTVAQVLKTAGYTTGIFGKWHLGDEDAYQPNRRGFDEVFIHGGGGIGQTYPGSCGDAPGNTYFNPAILHNGTFVKTKGFCTDVFFTQATAWIKEQSNKTEPFFAYIPTNAPHFPFSCPDSYKKHYLDIGMSDKDATYYGMITNIDDNVGRLLKNLEELHLSQRALVIFMSDNGSAVPNLYNAGMRGHKVEPYEGGTRVPAFFHWTGTLQPGVDVDKLAAHIDIFSTLAELAGATIPSNIELDGRSLVPLLQDPNAEWPDRFIFVHVGRWAKGKAEQSKYVNCAIRNNRFRLVNNKELYDIKNDPGEKINVIDKYPDIVAKMREAYDKWWKEVLPAMDNENAVGPKYNPFKERYWKQFGGGPEKIVKEEIR